jgi:outer membrane lipoprotein-sorting protein
VLSLAGCRREPPPLSQGIALLSEVKQALARRDAKLTSYHFVTLTAEGDKRSAHAFSFRSPNKMRAVTQSPVPFEWTFDGKQLYTLLPATKTFTTHTLNLPADQASIFLHTTFAPFVREGFRTPLMPMKGVTATRVAHPNGPEAVELKLEPGEGVTVTYVLRWPGADFLERRTVGPEGTSVLKVEAEHCEAKLALCVPRSMAELFNGQPRWTKELSEIALNVELPTDDFVPQVPAGWTAQTEQVLPED